ELGISVEAPTIDEDYELVATHPSDRVGFAQSTGKPRRHGEKQLVSSSVAKRVVHVLEVVQIDIHRRGGGPASSIAGEKLFDPIGDERAIGEASQWIVKRLVAKLIGSLTHECKGSRPAG